MRVSKQKMPDGGQESDKPSLYVIRDAISASRKTVDVPVISTHSNGPRTASVTLGRAPWEVDNETK